MLFLFAVLVALGMTCTLLFLLTFPEDRERNNQSKDRAFRPLYLIVLAISFWAMTYPALLAKDSNTIIIPTSNVIMNSTTNGNAIYTYSSQNVIITNNFPVDKTVFYVYLPIYIMIMIIHFVIAFMLYLWWIADTAFRATESD